MGVTLHELGMVEQPGIIGERPDQCIAHHGGAFVVQLAHLGQMRKILLRVEIKLGFDLLHMTLYRMGS